MKVLERIVDGLRRLVSIDDSQFGFVPGRDTADAIFVVRQLQEKYLAANKRLYMAFVDLEKAFDQVPRKVILWALRKLGVEEWIVRLVQGMYANERDHVRVGEGYSEEFEVKVGVHQGPVLSPLLFIINSPKVYTRHGILHHWGVQLILAYSWARPAILVVGKGRGGMFLFLLFLQFHSCSSCFPVPLFHLYSLFYLFSPFLWETTQNDPQGLTCR